jgi:LEA14-like dessication related protein
VSDDGLGLQRQLSVGVAGVVASPFRMSARSWRWFALYLGLSGALLRGFAALFGRHDEALVRALVSFLVPERWHGVADFVLAFVFKSQAQQVTVNIVLIVTLNVVSLVFFWTKELLSQSYERDQAAARGLDDPRGAWREYPIWYQWIEEIKWTLVGVALMFAVLWLGHSPEPWRKTTATVLSYGVLFFSAAGNYLAPPMQRRRTQYGQVIKAIFRKPLLALGFGAAVSLPQVALLHVVSHAELSAFVSLLIIFGVNIVFIAYSAVAGTHVGLALLPVAERTPRSSTVTKITAWLAVFAVLIGGAWILGRLGGVLAGKSQFLKCEYRIDWSTLQVDKPNLGGLLKGEVGVKVAFDVEIDNPNALPIRIEDNRLVVSDDDVVIAETRLSPLLVEARSVKRTRVGLDAKVRATSVLEGIELNPTRWDITLYIELEEGFELPIYLRGAN